MRTVVFLAVIGHAICMASAIKIPIGHFSKLLHRGPPIPEAKTPRMPVLEYIEQRVDNFDPSNHATYQMRYYRNDEFFNATVGGPIFIFVGGEWTISPESLRGGHMFDMAQELGGQMFYTEHRYYGESLPTPDASTENLRFLNVEQALADLAHFIHHMKVTHPEFAESKVILAGGSYSATMVAWFRQKYPQLAVGAWASSGPMLAQVDFFEYKEVAGAAIRSVGGEQCHQRVEGAIRQAEQLLENRNFAEFSSRFRTCDLMTDNIYDIWTTFAWFSLLFVQFVQYHRPGVIEGMCEQLLDPSSNTTETDLDAFNRWYTPLVFGNNPSDDDCIDLTYDGGMEFFRNSSWDHDATEPPGKQWVYQSCSEFGWYQTSGSRFQPFGSNFPIEMYIKFCGDIFGPTFNRTTMLENIRRKNVMYGGLNPEVTNVYFTQGSVDPWRVVGIQTDLNDRSPAVVIPGGSHGSDLNSNSPYDIPQLREARDRLLSLVRLWIGAD